jgi:hypothetical protein
MPLFLLAFGTEGLLLCAALLQLNWQREDHHEKVSWLRWAR